MAEIRRAVTLAGGGPAAGLHIGALQSFHKAGIEFDVWALSCIGAWVGVIYNTFEKDEAPQKTEEFFRDNIFREDLSYSRFPINHAFSPDLKQQFEALTKFVMDPQTYHGLIAPEAMMRTSRMWWDFWTNPKKWNEGDVDNLVLELMAANPMSRYMVSMMYLSGVNGLSRIWFPGSSLLGSIGFGNLKRDDKPEIYHNAFNLDKQAIQLFSNRPDPDYFVRKAEDPNDTGLPILPLTAQTLCACSALPFVEETVEINGTTYCEGALVETVNVDHLLDQDLDEVWVVRIVDKTQVRKPKNMTDALGNLCMLFAASLGEDNVAMMIDRAKHLEEEGKKVPHIYVLPVSHDINFDWNHKNLADGIKAGRDSADGVIAEYEKDKSAFSVFAPKASPQPKAAPRKKKASNGAARAPA